MMRSALIASAPIDNFSLLAPLIRAHDRIIAVDRGLHHCKAMNITPDLLVGDFDSVEAGLLAEYGHVPRITLARDKDKTDLEVALEHEFACGCKEATLFGALGARTDHTITNLLIACRYPGRVYLETESERIFAIQREMSISTSVGQTISLLPIMGPVTGITTQGLKWELKEGKLDAYFVGISNICLSEEIAISVQAGVLLCSLLRLKE